MDRTSLWQFHLSRGKSMPATGALLGSNKEPMLPKETVLSLTRYNLGSSAMKRNVPGHVLQRPSYLSRIQVTLLCNSSAEAL
ncbi:BLID isoform 1 [Pongo abelii]|uniref:BLID isoform 1 n=1 Tax=Pongo abelii TaxID=9601 RepID=A0A2J8X0C1_PONAB|nr:BLID isoform 1 [Pongo abelii]